jgi:hypothetical protein
VAMSLPDGYSTDFPVPDPDNPDNRTNSPEAASLSGKQRPGTPPDDSPTNIERPALALEQNILDVFLRDLRRAGVAGEARLARIIYLAVCSRLLPWEAATNRPVSVLVRGTTSTGKSHAMGTTLRFFPNEAIVDLGSMSRRFLFYDEDSYEHRVLTVPEASQVIGDDELLALLRTLLSEGRIVHGTVSADGKPKAFRIEKAGPTALLMTTTKAYVDEELETRMLSVRSDDTPEQTRRVYDVYAELEEGDGSGVDFDRWHQLQRWLATQENRVYVPFVRALAELMPTGATRLRRDFVSMLCLIRASAVLHQENRERHGERIAADLTDYAIVRDLIGAIVAEGVDAAVSGAVRETVEAAAALLEEGRAFVTPKMLTDAMQVGRSATYDRVRNALNAGYLADQSSKDERGMQLVLGASLPGDAESYLPTVDEVVRVMSGGHPDDANPHQDDVSDELSGSPARPADTGDDGVPLPGDPGFRDFLNLMFEAGKITHRERHERRLLHDLVIRSRTA